MEDREQSKKYWFKTKDWLDLVDINYYQSRIRGSAWLFQSLPLVNIPRMQQTGLGNKTFSWLYV